jgi:hypothetical protein
VCQQGVRARVTGCACMCVYVCVLILTAIEGSELRVTIFDDGSLTTGRCTSGSQNAWRSSGVYCGHDGGGFAAQAGSCRGDCHGSGGRGRGPAEEECGVGGTVTPHLKTFVVG